MCKLGTTLENFAPSLCKGHRIHVCDAIRTRLDYFFQGLTHLVRLHLLSAYSSSALVRKQRAALPSKAAVKLFLRHHSDSTTVVYCVTRVHTFFILHEKRTNGKASITSHCCGCLVVGILPCIVKRSRLRATLLALLYDTSSRAILKPIWFTKTSAYLVVVFSVLGCIFC